MAVKYKLWLHVERINEKTDEYDDIGLPEELGCSESEDEINQLSENVKNWVQFKEICDTKGGVVP